MEFVPSLIVVQETHAHEGPGVARQPRAVQERRVAAFLRLVDALCARDVGCQRARVLVVPQAQLQLPCYQARL